ncbi:MAG: hypothetical protein WCR20_08965 [Verrucomicrobiota bacterium]|nr:hypothetical protein [Verrucomicrobiota bacterium]
MRSNTYHTGSGGSDSQMHGRRAAFSLIEIMITSALLSFIVLGLLAMFNQTQRAFRSGMTQTDVLESGRAALDMLSRELEQITPSQEPYTTNFFAEPTVLFSRPMVQDLAGSSLARTNMVQKFYFLTRFNTEYDGIGYQVIPEYPNAGVGSLCRFSEGLPTRFGALYLSRDFYNAPLTNLNRIVDGVVHLRVRAFDTAGRLIAEELSRYQDPKTLRGGVPENTIVSTNIFVGGDRIQCDQAAIYMMSNAVPAFVELEMGVLEPQILRRWRSISAPEAQLEFLARYAPNVHIFRQRIPVRNVDFSAYQ